MHYSWEVHALAGDRPDTSILATRMRIEGLSHPSLLQKLGPVADRFTMNLVRQGIVGENSELSQANRSRKIGAAVGGFLGYQLGYRLAPHERQARQRSGQVRNQSPQFVSKAIHRKS